MQCMTIYFLMQTLEIDCLYLYPSCRPDFISVQCITAIQAATVGMKLPERCIYKVIPMQKAA